MLKKIHKHEESASAHRRQQPASPPQQQRPAYRPSSSYHRQNGSDHTKRKRYQAKPLYNIQYQQHQQQYQMTSLIWKRQKNKLFLIVILGMMMTSYYYYNNVRAGWFGTASQQQKPLQSQINDSNPNSVSQQNLRQQQQINTDHVVDTKDATTKNPPVNPPGISVSTLLSLSDNEQQEQPDILQHNMENLPMRQSEHTTEQQLKHSEDQQEQPQIEQQGQQQQTEMQLQQPLDQNQQSEQQKQSEEQQKQPQAEQQPQQQPEQQQMQLQGPLNENQQPEQQQQSEQQQSEQNQPSEQQQQQQQPEEQQEQHLDSQQANQQELTENHPTTPKVSTSEILTLAERLKQTLERKGKNMINQISDQKLPEEYEQSQQQEHQPEEQRTEEQQQVHAHGELNGSQGHPEEQSPPQVEQQEGGQGLPQEEEKQQPPPQVEEQQEQEKMATESEQHELKSEQTTDTSQSQLQQGQTENNAFSYDANDPFLQNILDNGNPSTSIYHYLKSQIYPIHLTILYWNSAGVFVRNSSVLMAAWFEDVKIYRQNIEVLDNSNYNGTVALLLTSDVLAAIRWGDSETDIQQPPVPIITYSLPNQYVNHPYYKLIPCPYDMNGQTIAWNLFSISEAEKTTKTINFHDRINQMVWRGMTHGTDMHRQILLDMGQDPKNSHWLNATSTNLDSGLNMASFLWFDKMSTFKYQIDIGGESGTTWGGLRWKMCSGNLVFKVDAYAVDWWHDTIKPWVHYIPVNHNISNLYELYQWAESHPEEAYDIAKRGAETCLQTSTEQVTLQRQKEIVQSLSMIPQSQEIIREANAIMNGWGSIYEPIIAMRKKEEEEKKQKELEETQKKENPVNSDVAST